MTTPIKSIGEAGLLAELLPLLRRHTENMPLGTGDDVAVTEAQPGGRLVWTIDTMVEGTHFRWWNHPLVTGRALGGKLVTSNVSDLASKGANPLFALVSLGVPKDASVATINDFYAGMDEALLNYGARLIGGDTVRAPQWCLTLALVGTIAVDYPLAARANARVGMKVYVTGSTGDSAAGLDILEGKLTTEGPHVEHLLRAHLSPEVSVQRGQEIIAACGRRCAMIDTSDGLVHDAGEIARASGVCIYLDSEAIMPSMQLRAAVKDKQSVWGPMTLNGGEDYRLLFCAEELPQDVKARLRVHQIGEVWPGSGVMIRYWNQGENTEFVAPAKDTGFQHFA
ncbi:thiamine-phosphate kinase [soil metagenome]